MKKKLVAAIIASTLTPLTSFADTSDTETMLVTASRSNQEAFDALAAVEIFDRDVIEQIQPESISDLLGRVAGITATTQGSAGHQTSLFFRGTNSDHVLVLVNGVRVGSATLGSKELATMPLALIERVEVVKGPRAALWGSDAIGGVIQIFTRQMEPSAGKVGASIGHDSFWQVYGSLGLGNADHQYTVTAFAEKTDGYDIVEPDPANIYAADQPDADGYDRQSVSLVGTSQITDAFSLEINAQQDKGNTEIDASFGGDEFDHDNYHALIRGHWKTDTNHYQLSYAKSVDSNKDNAHQLSEWNTQSVFETSRNQVDGLAHMQYSRDNSVTVGAEWYDEEITSHTAYSDTTREAYAFFATARQNLDKWKFEQAIRYDDVGETDSETTYQLSAGYQLSDQWLVALSHGTSFKAPSFNDLYWPDAFGSRGNPDLVSETSSSSEVLTRYYKDNWSIEISAYQTDIDDLIEWAPVDPSDPFSAWQPSNVAKATIKGLDLAANVSYEQFSHQISASHIDAENEVTKSQLFLRPYFSANYNLGYQLNEFDLALNVSYQGQRNDSSGVKLNSITLVNLTANYQVSNALAVFAKVTNLADKEYQLAYQYPGDGQGYRLGLDYQF